MGRQLQKKRNKSKVPKVGVRRKKRTKKLSILNNPLIAANWDKNQTVSQNYQRLGLTSRLNSSTGGTEAGRSADVGQPARHKPKPSVGEARIERDDAGNVTNIVYGKPSISDIGQLSSDEDAEEALPDNESRERATDVVRQLEEQASMGISKPRTQSDREQDWVRRLVERHGENYGAMFRDRKLNIWQQSEGDIKRRIRKWQEKQRRS